MTEDERETVKQFLLSFVQYEQLPVGFPTREELQFHAGCCVFFRDTSHGYGTQSCCEEDLLLFLDHFPGLPVEIRELLLLESAVDTLAQNT